MASTGFYSFSECEDKWGQPTRKSLLRIDFEITREFYQLGIIEVPEWSAESMLVLCRTEPSDNNYQFAIRDRIWSTVLSQTNY